MSQMAPPFRERYESEEMMKDTVITVKREDES